MSEREILYRKHIVLFIFVWLVINFFPGSYSIDSWYHYNEMVRNEYDDWHSPWMAYLWKILYKITDRYFIIYIFQMAWYFMLYYFLLKLVNNRIIFAVGLAISITLVFIPQYVMKDVHFALSWGSGFVILLYAGNEQPKYAKYAALLFMIYGLFLRPNTAPAILPFLYMFVEQYYGRSLSVVRKSIVSTALTVVFLGAYYVLTYFIFDTRRVFPEYKMKLMDVIGITKLSGHNYMPECVTSFSDYNEVAIMTQYSPASIDDLYWPADGKSLFPYPTLELNSCVGEAWKRAILDHPLLYLKNRAMGFLNYLRIRKRLPPGGYYNYAIWVQPTDQLVVEVHTTPFTDKIMQAWNRLTPYHFYDPWVWLVLNILLFGLFMMRFLRRKLYPDKILAALQLSGILYTFGMFLVFQVDRDFRYTYWNVLVVVIGIFGFFITTKVPEQASDTVSLPEHER
jgi:hypothetical protein